LETVRCFISIELDPLTRNRISQLVDNLKFVKGIKWVSEENYHITLAFMGQLPVSQVPLVSKALDEISSCHSSFELKLQGSGFFPNENNPKVFWIGIQKSRELYSLKRDLDESLKSLNIDFDAKPFSPHLTLGRIKAGADLSLLPSKIEFSASLTVKEIFFMKSQLFKNGPVYTQIYRTSLKGDI